MTTELTGTFAYRFEGHVLFQPDDSPTSPALTLYLVGVGVMHIDSSRIIRGTQDSTTTPIGSSKVVPNFPLVCKYQLEGKYAPDPNGVTGTADIAFTPAKNHPLCAAEQATFSIVRVAGDRFWFVSKKATAEGQPVDEVCTGEAVKIPDLPSG